MSLIRLLQLLQQFLSFLLYSRKAKCFCLIQEKISCVILLLMSCFAGTLDYASIFLMLVSFLKI